MDKKDFPTRLVLETSRRERAKIARQAIAVLVVCGLAVVWLFPNITKLLWLGFIGFGSLSLWRAGHYASSDGLKG